MLLSRLFIYIMDKREILDRRNFDGHIHIINNTETPRRDAGEKEGAET